jgi:hypothetical protein
VSNKIRETSKKEVMARSGLEQYREIEDIHSRARTHAEYQEAMVSNKLAKQISCNHRVVVKRRLNGLKFQNRFIHLVGLFVF